MVRGPYKTLDEVDHEKNEVAFQAGPGRWFAAVHVVKEDDEHEEPQIPPDEEPQDLVTFKKIKQEVPADRISATPSPASYEIFLNGKKIGINRGRKDYVKAKQTDRIRSKMATVWSVEWDHGALTELGLKVPRSSSFDTRRLDSQDVLFELGLRKRGFL